MSPLLLDVRGVDLDTFEGRPLVRDLTLQLGRERVAVVGRNGVGKSTLLRALAGEDRPTRGTVRLGGPVAWVPQDPGGPDAASGGERRRAALEAAFRSRPALLLLDEPTEDLDAAARAWLLAQLARWRGGLVVVSHDAELLDGFSDFFVIAESGCRHVHGTHAELRENLAADDARQQQQYARSLSTLEQAEAHDHRVRQRRKRKKAVGRLHELDRSQSRLRLNQRRGTAQVSQAKVAARQESRIDARRAWAKAMRRALRVSLPLDVVVPTPPPPQGPVIALDRASFAWGDREIVAPVTLEVTRERVAIVGPNGSGKTTLLRLMTGELAPTTGRARCDTARIGVIGQGAEDWRTDEALIERLARTSDTADPDALAAKLVAHRFPLPLAARPLASLSPGERTRAALIALFEQPGLEVVALDEPTWCLDPVGVAALGDALAAWTGGLVVVSHDREFLDRIGVSGVLAMGADA
ncbi:MAG: ABC-F family ATP-binding cassette domain-containing protein [Alphaproteobacteria bacterium]|nr:ABC-F family ATP-binding cassette domain-containing protein [Alphaproteobacteria bacterium]